MSAERRGLGRAILALVGLALVGACSSYDPNDRIDPTVGRPVADAGVTNFAPVALMLVDRCGQIDCHGSKYRNFRLYGYSSQRLFTNDTPTNPKEMRDEEVAENYNALVALEPQLFLQVVREGGQQPDRLTFMRKAREHEAHKGGKPIVEGDDADICLQSWLQGRTLEANCYRAIPRLNK